jgi:hypothetical protein
MHEPTVLHMIDGEDNMSQSEHNLAEAGGVDTGGVR